MKSIILLICFLYSANAFSETNIYRFSGAYVEADNTAYSDPITANEVLSLKDSTRYSFPEFYFSDYGEHGVTNWSSFPTSSRQVGSEFQLKVSRRIDDVLYLSKWEFRYCCFLGWDKKSEKLKFAASGGTLTAGEQCLGIGENRILSKGKDPKKTEWVVVRIDEVQTPRAIRTDATEEQIKLIGQWCQAIQSGNIEVLKSLYSETEESRNMGDAEWELGLKFLKETLTGTFGEVPFNIDNFKVLFAGCEQSGRIIISHDSGKNLPVHIIKSGTEWKMEM